MSQTDDLLARRQARANTLSSNPSPEADATGPLASARESKLAQFRLAESIRDPERAVDLAAHTQPAAAIEFPEGVELTERYKQWCREYHYTPRQNVTIPLDRLTVSQYNPRHFYNAAKIRSLVTSILQSEQQQPIVVSPDYAKPGHYIVHDGGSRVRALREARKSKALAIVIDMEPGIESYKLGHDLNTQRSEQTPFDDAVSWKRYLDSGEFSSQKDLAEALGKSEATITQVLKLNTLPYAVMEIMVGEPDHFNTRMSYEVARFHEQSSGDEEATRKLIDEIVRRKMTTKHVQEYRSRFASAHSLPVSNPRGGRRRSAASRVNAAPHVTVPEADLAGARVVEIRHQHGVAQGRLAMRGNDGLMLEFGGLPPTLREKLYQDIEQLLEQAHQA
ncbi:ParB/RepB/Spo0J family partition protein [Paraburkholderia sp. J8-2]|uniref:ParB/RepB/Spo0J family partition protein n=1 Tax=Paraburkholderia sp. J8-2 TaxID=2805440 RepID=UPI002AB7A510|nr:ParB/RepB/Spo0J family partition protein [Paraburkholderia sp. J8-2]